MGMTTKRSQEGRDDMAAPPWPPSPSSWQSDNSKNAAEGRSALFVLPPRTSILRNLKLRCLRFSKVIALLTGERRDQRQPVRKPIIAVTGTGALDALGKRCCEDRRFQRRRTRHYLPFTPSVPKFCSCAEMASIIRTLRYSRGHCHSTQPALVVGWLLPSPPEQCRKTSGTLLRNEASARRCNPPRHRVL